MDNQSIVAEKSFSFAVRIVKLYQYICNNKKEYVLSKMNIALKEAGETQYWLRLLTATEILTEKESRSILDDCTELLKMLTSIVKTTSSNLQ